MAPWEGQRKQSWASNGNIAVYIFGVLFIAWLGFQIWARMPGGPPPPTGLDPMIMAALGVAVTTKSVERRQAEDDKEHEQDDLKEQVKQLKEQIEQKPKTRKHKQEDVEDT